MPQKPRPWSTLKFGNITPAVGLLLVASAATQIKDVSATGRIAAVSRGQAVNDARQWDWLAAVSTEDSPIMLDCCFVTHSDLARAGVKTFSWRLTALKDRPSYREGC